jgi:hypothetical protein
MATIPDFGIICVDDFCNPRLSTAERRDIQIFV